MNIKKKQILSRLMALDDSKTNKQLVGFARELIITIQQSQDNDFIFEQLDLLEEFVYKVPDQTIKVTQYIIEKSATPTTIHKSKFGEIDGKSHKDLILKSIELLSHIRYITPDRVLGLIVHLLLKEDKEISNKALEVVKKFAQYDYNILTKSKIGYGAQRKILDFILAWSVDKRLQHIDFIETVTKELLSSSIKGSEWTKEDTLTMHFGAVDPTEFLKKMRREVMDLIYELYKATEDPKIKLRLVQVLEEVKRTPSNVAYRDNLIEMIVEDLQYLIAIYRKIIFGNGSGKMIANLSVVSAIEKELYWINKSEKRRRKETEELREEILQNDLYQLFRLLVGDPITYRREEDWDTAEQKHTEEIDKLINSIKESNLKEWSDKLNEIATQYTLIDEWPFLAFKSFIQKLADKEPQLADVFLDEALKNNLSFKYFTTSFLTGFRVGLHFELWDKYVDKIINTKDVQLTNSIIYSLNLPKGTDLEKSIREQDLDLLENIVKGQNQTSFLREQENQYERILHYALINTLARNHKRSPERIESLIVEEVAKNPKYLEMFFAQFPTILLHIGWINFQDLQPKIIDLLKEKMVELSDLDWHNQEVLLAIGQRDGLGAILDVFLNRINKDAKRKKGRVWRFDERYEAIPYHFNQKLLEFIDQHPDYKKLVGEWVKKMTIDWSIYNWNVSHFLQRVGKGFGDILMSIIEKGDDDNLMKAALAMYSIDGADFDLCIEIVRRTDNKQILGQIESNMYATGVVSGEYGIANAHKKKAEELEKYKKDESECVRRFVKRMIKNFKERAKRERQGADEEKQLRKIEFEG